MLKLFIFCLVYLASVQGRTLDEVIDVLYGNQPPDANQKLGNRPRLVQQGAIPLPSQGQGGLPIPQAPSYQGTSASGQQGAVPVQSQIPPASGFQNNFASQEAFSAQSQFQPRPQQPPANLPPGDYRWGAWGPYGPCTATCGQGQRISRRVCYRYEPNKQSSSSGGLGGGLLPLMFLGGNSGLTSSSGGMSDILTLSMLGGRNTQTKNTQTVTYDCLGPDNTAIPCTPLAACVSFRVPPAVIPSKISPTVKTTPPVATTRPPVATTRPPVATTQPPAETLPPAGIVPPLDSLGDIVPPVSSFSPNQFVPPIETAPQIIPPQNCYTPWGDYGECLADCGDAVRVRARECTCPTCAELLMEFEVCAGLPPCGGKL